jgi:hypothetical protein
VEQESRHDTWSSPRRYGSPSGPSPQSVRPHRPHHINWQAGAERPLATRLRKATTGNTHAASSTPHRSTRQRPERRFRQTPRPKTTDRGDADFRPMRHEHTRSRPRSAPPVLHETRAIPQQVHRSTTTCEYPFRRTDSRNLRCRIADTKSAQLPDTGFNRPTS